MAFENYSFIAGSLCQSGYLFLRSGYKERTMPLEEAIENMAVRGLAKGVELHYGDNEPEGTWEARRALLKSLNLKTTFMNTWIYGERMWRFGALSAADEAVRKITIGRCKKTIDCARMMGVGIWLGQDAFDYAFQTNYDAQWDHLVQSLKELCDYANGMTVALEPKPREPRNRSLVDNVQTALLLRHQTGCENLGHAGHGARDRGQPRAGSLPRPGAATGCAVQSAHQRQLRRVGRRHDRWLCPAQ